MLICQHDLKSDLPELFWWLTNETSPPDDHQITFLNQQNCIFKLKVRV